ncbi:hypothetical protein PPUJ20066_08340 [Pseudomonas putida]|uniref:hypothetical protein n=1 Tax=Pseudomonas sp. RTCS2 TaxID=3389877 RepID=UPI00235D0CE2|nr:hypothetical protein PPUJ20066_08340 [Pseudomonas putida]
MQVQTQEVSDMKATTGRRPRLASHSLDLPNHCDICNRARSHGSHQRCSKIRQQRKSLEWEAYMANVEAKRTQKARRHA